MAGEPPVSDLLDRRARGEKLTPRELGRIGGHLRSVKAGRLAPQAAAPAGSSPRPGARPGPPPAAEILARDAAADPSAAGATPGADVDDDVIKETTKAVLAGIDQGIQQYTCDLAQRIGADRTALADYRKAVALPTVPSAALVEVSPALVRRAGITSLAFHGAPNVVGVDHAGPTRRSIADGITATPEAMKDLAAILLSGLGMTLLALAVWLWIVPPPPDP